MSLVEGQTEQTFCEVLLYPWLDGYAFKLGPTRLDPSGAQQGRSARGGHAHRFRVIERDLERVLRARCDVVTTLLDLYHLPPDFPGMEEAQRIPDPVRRAEHLEHALYERMGSPHHFVPNLLVQEFEALLFASPEVLSRTDYLPAGVRAEMRAVADAFPSPEQINHDRPPGVRLTESAERYGSRYEKPLQGNLLALEVGIEAMRARCAHFAAWTEELRRRA
jgi:hypothetical protein